MAKSYNHLKVLPVLMFLLLLTGCTFLFDSSYVRPPIPNEPRAYNAEYNKVWNSALDTIDELGYVIAQMDKADGYITTDRKGGDTNWGKISLRIVDVGNKVTVKVNWYTESRRILSYDSAGEAKSYSSWSKNKSDGYDEKMIKDIIAVKLGLTQ